MEDRWKLPKLNKSLLETVAAVQRDCEEIEEQQRVACVLQLAGTADESQESGGSSLFAAMDKDADERRGTWQPLADMFFDEEAQEVDNQLEASRSPGLTDSFDPDVEIHQPHAERRQLRMASLEPALEPPLSMSGARGISNVNTERFAAQEAQAVASEASEMDSSEPPVGALPSRCPGLGCNDALLPYPLGPVMTTAIPERQAAMDAETASGGLDPAMEPDSGIAAIFAGCVPDLEIDGELAGTGGPVTVEGTASEKRGVLDDAVGKLLGLLNGAVLAAFEQAFELEAADEREAGVGPGEGDAEVAEANGLAGRGSLGVDTLHTTPACASGNDVLKGAGGWTAVHDQSDFGAAIEAARATQAAAVEAWEQSRGGSKKFGAFVCRLWESFAEAKGCEAWPHGGPEVDTVILWLWHVQRTPQSSHVEQGHERYMQLIKQAMFALICQKCPGFKAQSLEIRKDVKRRLDVVLKQMRFISGFCDRPITKEPWDDEMFSRAFEFLSQDGHGDFEAVARALLAYCRVTGDRPGSIGRDRSDGPAKVVFKCSDVAAAGFMFTLQDGEASEPRVHFQSVPKRFKGQRGSDETFSFRESVTSGGRAFEDPRLQLYILLERCGRFVPIEGVATVEDAVRARLLSGNFRFREEAMEAPVFPTLTQAGKFDLDRGTSSEQVSKVFEKVALRMGCEPGKSSAYSARKHFAVKAFETGGLELSTQLLHHKGKGDIAGKFYIGDGRGQDTGSMVFGAKPRRMQQVNSLARSVVEGQPLHPADVPDEVLNTTVYSTPVIAELRERVVAMRTELERACPPGLKGAGLNKAALPESLRDKVAEYEDLQKREKNEVTKARAKAVRAYRKQYRAEHAGSIQGGMLSETMGSGPVVGVAVLGSIDYCVQMVGMVPAEPLRR